jgi:hypothetical protein
MTEEFKIVDGYNYSISNLGRVRNDKTGTFKKGINNGKGYLRVHLYKNNIPKSFLIHRLIGIYFIENVNNCKEIDHLNRNKLDNCVDNLRWATSSQNQANRGKKQNTTSIYKGVSFDKVRDKWISRISKDNKQKYLGFFLTEIEAFDCRKKYILDKNLQEFYN